MSVKTPRWLTNHELCELLGYSKTPGGVENARRFVLRRIEAGGERLAKYDPRVDKRHHPVGERKRVDSRWKITYSALKKICPEIVDEEIELADEVKKRLADILATIDELAARIERTASASRKRDDVLADAIRSLRTGPPKY